MCYTKEMIHAWHEEGVRVASQWLRCEHRMVELLGHIYQSEGYYLYGCESLKEYALSMWSLPENAARDLVTVAIKATEIPTMVEALKEGRATVSKLRKVCPVITLKDQDEWLDLVEECSTRVIEKAVATVKPESVVQERMTYKSETLLELKVGISEELSQKLERILDLLSQKERRSVTLAQALEAMAELFLEKMDPIRKAERSTKKQAKGDTQRTTERNATTKEKPEAEQRKSVTGRKPLSAETEHAVNLRDQTQCTHVREDGTRCPNRRWTEIHHRVPVADGGSDEIENLQTLCSAHHRAYHHKWWRERPLH